MGIVGRTVLVVDDEPQIRALLREYLAAEGYQVLEADSGATALRQLGMLSEPVARNVDLSCSTLGCPTWMVSKCSPNCGAALRST